MKRKVTKRVSVSYLAMAVFVVVSILSSCKEEEGLLLLESTSSGNAAGIITVKDGRIAFDDPSSLKYFMEEAQTKDFINEYVPSIRKYEDRGFTSLTPLFSEGETDRIEQYKQTKLARLNIELNKSGRTFNREDLDDEDELIADSYFASLLNEKREIQVGDIVYKYTEYGAFYTRKANLDKLYQYLSKAGSNKLMVLPPGESTEVSPGIFLFKQSYRSDIQDSYQYESGEQSSNSDLFTANTVPIDDPGPGSGGGSPKPTYPDAPDPVSLTSCGSMNSNLVTKVFGPAITCHSNFDSKKRIRVRAWNQNFLVYSSLGVKVKSQRKTAGIWFESDADELILGIDAASFKIPAMGSMPKRNGSWYTYSYNGYLIDHWGNISSKTFFPQKPFRNFPVSDRDHKYISVFAFGGLVDYTLTGSKINGYAKKAVKAGVNALSRHFKTSDTKSKPAVITHTTDRNIYITIANYEKRATNKSRIEEVFDFNVLVKLTFNPSTISGISDIKPSPKSYDYKEYIGSFYGMGRRGRIWRGRRVEYNEKR